jgi:hypothetical protein
MYLVEEESHTVVQYSVAADWTAKIRATVRRLAETRSNTRRLIYATNRVIGPDADDLVCVLRRENRISLDVRDRNWFVDREMTYPQRQVAANELARKFVDPLLVERGVRSFASPTLGSDEARVALVHLALDGEDEATDKGWTKRCFEALVLSALHDTSSDAHLTREEVIERVRALLPAGHDPQIAELVTGALGRLSRKGGPVKDHRKAGLFALSYEEQERLRTKVTGFALNVEQLNEELSATVRAAAPRLELSDEDWAAVAEDLRFGLETVLLRRGEAFARTVTSGEVQQASARDVLAVITAEGRSTGSILRDEEAASAIIEVLERPSPGLRMHLRRLADAYTMYAFLRQTPDVSFLAYFVAANFGWIPTLSCP